MFDILLTKFEKADEINPGLMEWIKSDSNHVLATESRKTSFYCKTSEKCPVEELDILFDWMRPNLVLCANKIAEGSRSAYFDSPDWHRNFDIADYWGMWYDEGAWAMDHNHWPYAMSFAYYVNCPERCSPIVIEEEEYEVESGQLIIFPGHLTHRVDPCPVDNRVMVAGNIAYTGGLGKGLVEW